MDDKKIALADHLLHEAILQIIQDGMPMKYVEAAMVKRVAQIVREPNELLGK